MLFYMGTKEEVENLKFYKDFLLEKANWTLKEQALIDVSVVQYESYIQHRGEYNIFPLLDVGGWEQFYIGSRIVSKEYVKNNPTDFLSKYAQAISSTVDFHYFMGGKVLERDTDEMALNPAFRGAIFQLQFFTPASNQKMIDFFPEGDGRFGSGLRLIT